MLTQRAILSVFVTVLFIVSILALPQNYPAVWGSTLFPQDGASVKYRTRYVYHTTVGNSTLEYESTYSFHSISGQWNVTEIVTGQLSCQPASTNLTVWYYSGGKTQPQFLGSDTSGRVQLENWFIVTPTRAVVASDPDLPSAFEATCHPKVADEVHLYSYHLAWYAAPSGIYADFYIANDTQPGSRVRVIDGIVGPLAAKNVTFFGTTRVAMYGNAPPTPFGEIMWYYFDQATGLLLWQEMNRSRYSARIASTLVESTIPIPEFSVLGELFFVVIFLVPISLACMRRPRMWKMAGGS